MEPVVSTTAASMFVNKVKSCHPLIWDVDLLMILLFVNRGGEGKGRSRGDTDGSAG
jgi:hypothetical protein